MDSRTPAGGGAGPGGSARAGGSEHGSGPAGSSRTSDRPSHYRPRTREGRIAVALFVVLMALAQPPVVHALADRTEPWILGLPFLYVWLLAVYSALIVVLIWAMKKGL